MSEYDPQHAQGAESAAIEDLDVPDEAMEGVAGGTEDVTLNKSKTADKAAAATDAYLRG
jgi:hypothetical protein